MPSKLMDKYAKVGLPCLDCGEHTEQSVSWLKMHERLFCFACGSAIDLTTPENRGFVDQISKIGASLPILGDRRRDRAA